MTTQRLVARMDDPDAEHPNPIHSTASAQSYGFAGALVGGVTLFSWAVPTIVETLGEGWLDEGWVDMSFRRPVYPQQELTVSVIEADGAFEIATDATCVRGAVGVGVAEFLGEIVTPESFDVHPVATPLPFLTPDNVPVGQELAVLAVDLRLEDAVDYATSKALTEDPAMRRPARSRTRAGSPSSRSDGCIIRTTTAPRSMPARVCKSIVRVPSAVAT